MLAGPAPHGSGDEFRPVIGAQYLGCSMGQDSQVKHFDHVGGSHAPLDAESQVLTGELIDNVTDLEHAPLSIRIKLEINGPHLPRSASLDQALQARRSAGFGGFARAQAAPRPSPASRQSAQACASRTSSWSSILPGHKQPGLLRTTLSKQTVRKTQTPPNLSSIEIALLELQRLWQMLKIQGRELRARFMGTP